MQYFIIIGAITLVCVCISYISDYRRKRKAKEEDKERLYLIENKIDEADRHMQTLFGDDHYFTGTEADLLSSSYKDLDEAIFICGKHNTLLYLSDDKRTKSWNFHILLGNLDKKRREHNQEFITLQLKAHKDFFDKVLKYPLDEQQRKAIVTLEDNTLVVSAAGSGKTSTMIGKVKYLIEKRGIDPRNILILTYTRKATQELNSRLLGYKGLECHTFHSLARTILAKEEQKSPSICNYPILGMIYDNLLKMPSFKHNINRYFLEFQSLMKDAFEYADPASYYAERSAFGTAALFPDKYGHTIFTKSEEERKICHFLFINGVKFTYEEPYPLNTATWERRQYTPDFSIYFLDKSGTEQRIYLEHFAINARGETPRWFRDKYGSWENANREYINGMAWKRHLHSSNGTVLIETTSAMFHNNTWRQQLLNQLRVWGVPIVPLSDDQIYSAIVQKRNVAQETVVKLLESFISLLKANLYNLEDIISQARSKKDARSEFIVSTIVKPVYSAYEQKLRERGEIDFTDLILKATDYSTKNKECQRYDYILIDEFQDISKDRYRLLKAIRKLDGATKLFCVGDDWQSIFRFAGSDMDLFSQFSDYFGHTEQCRIETTYRFFEPLISKSSAFIMQNPAQAKKAVKQRMTAEEKILREYIVLLWNRGKLSPSTITGTPPPMKDEDFVKNLCLIRDNKPNLERNALREYRGIPYREAFISELTKQGVNVNRSAFNEEKNLTRLHLCPYNNATTEVQKVADLLMSIPLDVSVYVLGRYSFDKDVLTKNCADFKEKELGTKHYVLNFRGRDIPFYTVHQAKGLEADIVIVLNCNSGIYGFPSTIVDDPVLSYLLSTADKYEFGEERRVFYVAITRAKKEVYVMYQQDNPSAFIKEFDDVPKQKLCPICQIGHIVSSRDGVAVNGNRWVDYQCTNWRVCGYRDRVWYNQH